MIIGDIDKRGWCENIKEIFSKQLILKKKMKTNDQHSEENVIINSNWQNVADHDFDIYEKQC